MRERARKMGTLSDRAESNTTVLQAEFEDSVRLQPEIGRSGRSGEPLDRDSWEQGRQMAQLAVRAREVLGHLDRTIAWILVISN
jgi:hypothetical protein